jgi:hypothetical protein
VRRIGQRTRDQLATTRAPQWVQGVDRPDEWAVEHRWFLQAAFEAFDRDGDWPTLEDLQRELADDPQRAVAAAQLAIDIPASLGARFSQQVQLTVRALSYCHEAATLLRWFVLAMREAVARYPGDGPDQPLLRGLDVKAALGLDPADYGKLSMLLFSESWFFGSGGGDPRGDWHRAIRAEILLLNDVTDINGYLDAVAHYRFGAPEAPASPSTEPSRGLAARPLRWLAKREASVLDLIVIAALGGVLAGIVLWLLLR